MSERKETIMQLVKSLLITTLFCTVIAMMTSNIWPSPFYEHITISLGYGYSAVLCSFVLENNFPTLKKSLLHRISHGAFYHIRYVSRIIMAK